MPVISRLPAGVNMCVHASGQHASVDLDARRTGMPPRRIICDLISCRSSSAGPLRKHHEFVCGCLRMYVYRRTTQSSNPTSKDSMVSA